MVFILSLTGGFFTGQMVVPLLRPLIPFSDFGALLILVGSEVFVRLRSLRGKVANPSLLLQAVDNIRVGFVFSVVLEAFKLGS